MWVWVESNNALMWAQAPPKLRPPIMPLILHREKLNPVLVVCDIHIYQILIWPIFMIRVYYHNLDNDFSFQWFNSTSVEIWWTLQRAGVYLVNCLLSSMVRMSQLLKSEWISLQQVDTSMQLVIIVFLMACAVYITTCNFTQYFNSNTNRHVPISHQY